MNEETHETEGLSAPMFPSGPRWLTRNTAAFGLMSLFSDMGHELVTAALPMFLATIGLGAGALGIIEGFSDGLSSLVKMWMSFYSDRVGKRKPILAAGYAATSMLGAIAWVTAGWQLLLLRIVAWTGRGARGPVRDALLTESVPTEVQGRAFGFVRGMDTVGAIAGPAIALSLVGTIGIRRTFLIAFIPSLISTLIAVFVVRDIRRRPQPEMRLIASLRNLPPSFWRFVLAVGVFGLGNFAHTLLILRAGMLLAPNYGNVRAGQFAMGLYIFHNVIYALGSYPAGALADRINKKTLLACGYALFGVMCLGFMDAGSSLTTLIVLFALAGIYIAIVDTVERALAAGFLPENLRGTGYGALATVNSIGDLLSSLVVGMLWSHVSVPAGFWYAAILTFLGAGALFFAPGASGPNQDLSKHTKARTT